jgi:hypothetical protein
LFKFLEGDLQRQIKLLDRPRCKDNRELRLYSRDNMNNLKSEINKAAHYLAQVQAVRIKYALDAKCRAMLKEGKSMDDVARYLVQIATDGGNGLDALIGTRYPVRTGAL